MKGLITEISLKKLLGMIVCSVLLSIGVQSRVVSNIMIEWDNKLIDCFFLLRDRTPKVSSDIVIVYLDNDTLMDYGRLSPVSRKLLTELILNISEKGASVIGLDVLLDQPGPEEDDNLLAKALAIARNKVVLVAGTTGLTGEDQPLLPLSFFLTHTAFGYSEIQADASDIVRSISLGSINKVSSFTELIYRKYLASKKTYIRQPAKEVPHRSMRINFTGSPDRPEDRFPKFLSIKAGEVVQAADELFRNRIVLIGASNETSDSYYTPYSVSSNRNKKAFGIEIQAEAINSLIHQSWLTEVHWVPMTLIIFMAVFLTIFSLTVIGPLINLTIPLAFLLGLPVVSAVLFTHEQVFFPVLRIETAILISVLFWQPILYFRAIKRNLLLLRQRLQVEKSLVESQQAIRNLSSHQQKVIEDERKRIARELHDEMGQSLVSIKLGLEYLSQEFGEVHGNIEETTLEMISEINLSLKSIKDIITDLRPKILDDMGIGAAVDFLTRDFQRKTGIECRLILRPDDLNIGQDISTDIFRMVQELLTNVVKHAKATKIRVSAKQGSRLIIQVSDDGKGISSADILAEKSFGLLGIKERVLKYNGFMRIRGIEGVGTTVKVVIPQP